MAAEADDRCQGFSGHRSGEHRVREQTGKSDDLTAAGADAIIERIDELTEAIRAS